MPWLTDRLSDLLRWPIGVVRNFPARIARLGQTVVDALDVLVGLSSALLAYRRSQTRASWRTRLRTVAVHVGGWVAGLLARLFDLAGGPEVVEFVLRGVTHSSRLTAAEIAAAKTVLGARGVRWTDVRICEGGLLRPIFRRNHGRAFTVFHSIAMPPEGYASRANLDIVIHELVHVRQYEVAGSIYIVEALWGQQAEGYDYGGAEGLRRDRQRGKFFRHYNREQQAQIVQDYFALLRAGQPTSDYEVCIADCREGAL